MIITQIHERIAQIMEDKRITQYALAQRMGTSRQNVNHMLKCDVLTTKTIDRIFEALGEEINIM